ncbi:hypothetical protein AHMF7616_04747 [Adhaeribacter pallidiroseus]|uniref:Uncharacterized protein n=1 Tax=Adhaeribacter pallidiroseus TaxID=2072847 RepID=A0A369QS13_9BACT|nr:hypothetical protein AHMF7616_04747 [Adhaeribacter pallidiroseus]
MILFPFVNDYTYFFKKKSALLFFIPSRFIVLVSSTFVAYNYDMWNIVFSQLAYFTTLWILFSYSRFYTNQWQNIFTISIVLLVCLFTQVIYLAFGNNFIRSWDITEYKELFIALAYFMYSIETLINKESLILNKTNT